MGRSKSLKSNQIQRTQAPNISETPRAAQLKQKMGGDNSGYIAPIKFTVKKPRK